MKKESEKKWDAKELLKVRPCESRIVKRWQTLGKELVEVVEHDFLSR